MPLPHTGLSNKLSLSEQEDIFILISHQHGDSGITNGVEQAFFFLSAKRPMRRGSIAAAFHSWIIVMAGALLTDLDTLEAFLELKPM